jgi:hypothetical protein
METQGDGLILESLLKRKDLTARVLVDNRELVWFDDGEGWLVGVR